MGSELSTAFLAKFYDEEYQDIPEHKEEQDTLLKLGLLDIVLGFLGRCCEDFGSDKRY